MGLLVVYTYLQDDCTLLTAFNDTSSVNENIAGIGCFSYTSITKHDLYLFFL